MRIGEVAARTGLSTKAIRFYEQAGLVPPPPRTPGGYRDYPAEVLARLAFVRHAQAAGFTLAQVRGILGIRDGGHAPCQHVTWLVRERLGQVEERIAQLSQTREALRELARHASATSPAECAEPEICSILTGH
jgi:MerR family transcriptional regulator, copper efflux regulator